MRSKVIPVVVFALTALAAAAGFDLPDGPRKLYLSPEMIMGCVVLGFGVVAISIMAYMANKGKMEGFAQESGVALIITAVLFLIVTGYSEAKMAPVLSLLGTVAGYLLRGPGKA